MESAREDTKQGDVSQIYVNADAYSGEYGEEKLEVYKPKRAFDETAQAFGHGNSDFYTMYHFVEKLLGNPEADTIDVYEAIDMFLPGLFAYRSVLKGGVPVEIPNLRDKAVRDQWRNDTACTDPKTAGDMLIPSYSKGNPPIDDAVYEHVRLKWEEENK